MIKQQGFLSIVAAVLIVILGFLGVAAALMFTSSARSSADHNYSTQAFYVADAGLERATRGLLHPTVSGTTGTGTNERIACSNITGNANFNAVTLTGLPGTVVTVTGGTTNYPSTPVTLNGALSASATTIPVTGTIANYASTGGRLMIDGENMSYSGVSGNSFIGVARGLDGSTATTHVTGTRVGQSQCVVTSAGGVPSLAAPLGKRTLTQAVALQEAWIVGQKETVVRFDGSTNIWSDFIALGATQLNSVSMVSYADGVGVGNSAVTIQWNGSTWAVVANTLTAVNLNSVSCANNPSATVKCVAVGNAKSGSTSALTATWNGSTWTNVANPLTANIALQGVSCPSSSFCVAVGAATASHPLTATYNGTSWTAVVATAIGNNVLNSVSCPSTTYCVAVGAVVSGAPLTATFNGTTWTNVSNALGNVVLNAVSCPPGTISSTNQCMAVGAVTGGAPRVARFDGTTWTTVTNTLTSVLNDVKCLNNNDCWAVGTASGGEVIAHWNGSTFTRLPISGIIANNNFFGIDAVGPGKEPWGIWKETF